VSYPEDEGRRVSDFEAEDARVRMLTEKWAKERAKQRERAARRTAKRVRKRVVERYLGVLAMMNDPQGWSVLSESMRAAIRLDFDHFATQLRDCERVEIDRRLGADALPSGREGRT
jgi:hypothetical protein